MGAFCIKMEAPYFEKRMESCDNEKYISFVYVHLLRAKRSKTQRVTVSGLVASKKHTFPCIYYDNLSANTWLYLSSENGGFMFFHKK